MYVNVICNGCGVIYSENREVKGKVFHPVTTLLVWCCLSLELMYDDVERIISFLSLNYARCILKCAIEKKLLVCKD